MKKTKQHISLLLAAFMAAGLSSCIKEDYAGSDKDTATINLVFSTRADSDGDGIDEDARANEGIKTLRVILVQGGRVIENYKATGLGAGENPLLSQTITFWQIPKAQSTFYAIANEESIEGLEAYLSSFTPGDSFGTDEDSAMRTYVIETQTGSIPGDADGITAEGLPIAGIHVADLTTATDGQVITIPITRAVAKMELILTNATGDNFELSQVVLGSFFPDKTYLFPQETELALPDGVAYDDHTFSTNATLSDGESQTFYFYFYESKAGEGAYTIALNNGADYAAAPIMLDEDKPLTSVSRNTCLRVTGTIESALNPVLTDLQLLVKPWTEKNIDVPPFE